MVKIAPFGVEKWMDTYETLATHNLAETCCASISLDDLKELSEDKKSEILSTSAKMTYGEIPGLKQLRDNLSNLYSSRVSNPLSPDNILITPGAIAANHLIFYTLVHPGDHIICHYPTYQQLYAIPESLGAEVSLWKASPDKDWIPSVKDLESLVKPNTKLIIINNPNNPTGAILPAPIVSQVVELAQKHNITVLSDEVYRPVFHSIMPMSPSFPSSILSVSSYPNVIATGSLSKAYSLAGIRVGWIASRNKSIIEEIMDARHYTTISVSQLDSKVAAYALSDNVVHKLLARNIALAKTNLDILEKFVLRHDEEVSWVKPIAGTTAFLRFSREGKDVDCDVLCERLVKETGVLWAPGSVFGKEFGAYIRIGFVCETDVLKEGLDKVKAWMKKNFDEVPLL